MTVEEMLAQARSGLARVEPLEASRALAQGAGAVLLDIRTDSQRARDGVVPGARFIHRNHLEWRCDPESDSRDPATSDPDALLIVMCDEGYTSSLAAATLHELGLPRATDLIGGFQAWRAAGLPVAPAPRGAAPRAPAPRAPAA